MHNGRFINYALPDPQHRRAVYTAIEDAYGRVWAGNGSGVYRLDGAVWTPILMNRANTNDFTVALVEGPKGTLWTGTMTGGLAQITYNAGQAVTTRRFTVQDGLTGNPIRTLYAEKKGPCGLGPLTGDSPRLREGKFYHFTSRDGLYSDSISHVEDDGQGNLWLSTTRGLSRVPRQQFEDVIAGKIHTLRPENFGIADGLRSMQCGPGAPAGSGAARTFGRLLFPTAGGVASIRIDSLAHEVPAPPPSARILEISADGHSVDLSGGAKLGPGTSKIQFRYTGVYLSAPERVMPVMSGFEALAGIRSEFHDARLVALSTFGGDEDIRRALHLGARAYLTKDALHDDLIGAIRAVHAGRTYLPSPVAAALDAGLSHQTLSARELSVLEFIVQGLSNKQIAFHLGIPEETTKNRVKSILRKMGADDRTQAATKAIQRGIVHLPQ